MDYLQKFQEYFDMAQIDYYSGSVKGFQKLVIQAAGDFVPLNKIKEYLYYREGGPKPILLQ